MPFPLFSEAMVLSPDPKAPGLRVILASGQMPSLPVKVGHHGAADGAAVDQKPLPRPGTWGLCAFPGGDNRNGVWLCSLYLSQVDAYTSETDPNMDFQAHYSGAFELLDGQGNWTKSFPDGTFIQAAATAGVPTLNRHVVDATQTRQLVPFTPSQRVGSAQTPRTLTISHASGTTQVTSPSGAVAITGAEGAPITITFGGSTVVMNANGTMSLTDASGTILAFENNGTVKLTGNLVVTGNISDQNGADMTLAALRTAYNAHGHTGVQGGTGTSGTTNMPVT
jgi:hypothetical protein